MKLHLPKTLRAALLAAVAAVTSLGSADAATYDNLTGVIKDTENSVFYDGQGKFYVDSAKTTIMTVTIDLDSLKSYQHSNDYKTVYNGTSTFVTWSYSNGNSWGLADYWKNPQQDMAYANYGSEARLTGYWNSQAWNPEKAASGGSTYYSTFDTLSQYATDGKLAVTITNNPVSGGSITATCTGTNGNTVTLYKGIGLYDSNVTQTTAYTVNLNYVTSVTLDTASVLDLNNFQEPKDYSRPYMSTRWNEGDKSSLGRVLFAGDSITHGVNDMTWRWQMFKTFQDNGIENEIAGPREGYSSDPNTSDYQGATTTYGGETFNNAHLAQSSGRTHNIVTGSAAISGVNYGGWSTAKTAGSYDADTIVCLMGTNDILSDGGTSTSDYCTKFAKMLGGTVNYENGKYVWSDQGTAANNYDAWGTFGKMVGDLSKQERDTVYVMSVPCWTNHANSNGNSFHEGAMQFNSLLEDWTVQYGAAKNKNVVYVDVNKGLIDPSATTPFYGNASFFRVPGSDGLHPNEQGSLIIAGNLAKGMGLGGRTAGLVRSSATSGNGVWTSAGNVSLSAGESVSIAENVFNRTNGYTVDFKAVFGNGATDNWAADSTNHLDIRIGDGGLEGTLSLTEAHIMWGNKVLYCQDNSQAADSLRVAYHNGNSEDNVGAGFYVWLDDMLIGQGLAATTGSTFNGITMSSAGSAASISGITYSNTAYAPTTTGIYNASTAYFVEQEVVEPMPSHDSTPLAGPTDFSGAATAGKSGNAVYANSSTSTAGTDRITTTGAAVTGSGNWYGAQGGAGVNYKGNLSLQLTEGASGTCLFGVVNTGTVNGDVTVQVESANLTTFTSGAPSIIGGYKGNITGAFTAVLNGGTLSSGILGGFHSADAGNSIGSVNLIVNGGTVGGDVRGGSLTANGTVKGDVHITITGGTINGSVYGGGTAGKVEGNSEITITGGVINGSVNGKGTGSETFSGTSTVTVEGNKASIRDGITADTVKLRNVERSGYSDGFDRYSGTITANTVELDNYTAGEVKATIVAGKITATNGTHTALSAERTTMQKLSAEGGSIDLLNVSSTGLSLSELVIGDSRTVTALVSGTAVQQDESNVAKVAVTGTLDAKAGATLNANLTLAAGSTLKVAAGGLELGCTLTLNEGINLGDEQLATLSNTHYVTLFSGVDSLTLAGIGIENSAEAITFEQGIDAGRFFNLPTATDVTATSPVKLIYTGADNGGIVALTTIPEPATATLSLLALAALAARRRRH